MILDLNLRRRHLISGECERRTIHDGSALDGDHLARWDRDACEEAATMYGAGALLCLRIEPATHRSEAPRGRPCAYNAKREPRRFLGVGSTLLFDHHLL